MNDGDDSEKLLEMRNYAAARTNPTMNSTTTSSASGTRLAAAPRGTELCYTVAELNILELAAKITSAARKIIDEG